MEINSFVSFLVYVDGVCSVAPRDSGDVISNMSVFYLSLAILYTFIFVINTKNKTP